MGLVESSLADNYRDVKKYGETDRYTILNMLVKLFQYICIKYKWIMRAMGEVFQRKDFGLITHNILISNIRLSLIVLFQRFSKFRHSAGSYWGGVPGVHQQQGGHHVQEGCS